MQNVTPRGCGGLASPLTRSSHTTPAEALCRLRDKPSDGGVEGRCGSFRIITGGSEIPKKRLRWSATLLSVQCLLCTAPATARRDGAGGERGAAGRWRSATRRSKNGSPAGLQLHSARAENSRRRRRCPFSYLENVWEIRPVDGESEKCRVQFFNFAAARSAF